MRFLLSEVSSRGQLLRTSVEPSLYLRKKCRAHHASTATVSCLQILVEACIMARICSQTWFADVIVSLDALLYTIIEG